MRTITENHFDRLVLQAEEAEILSLTKVANHLTKQIEKAATRADDTSYTYSDSSLKDDVETCLWDAVVRIADFHNTSVDAVSSQGVIEALATSLIREIQIKAGFDHGVGAYEPSVPGEDRETISISVEE